jgi:hypothetical protein
LVRHDPHYQHIIGRARIRRLSLGADKQTAQQERMKICNAQASKKELKGDERQAFMSRCLSGDSAKKKDDDKELTAQQERMKTCNAQASKKELKGDERKTFMSKCLSDDKSTDSRDGGELPA